MCAPAAAAPAIALGAAKAGAGALGAVGKFQGQQAQVSAANQATASNYKYQMKVRERQWNRERLRYAQQVNQYNQTIDENEAAYNRSVAGEQRRLNNAYKAASFSNQQALINLAQSSGKVAASGAAGKSAQRLDMDVVSAFGRNQAIMAENLLSAQTRNKVKTEALGRQLLSANNRAFSDIAIAPIPTIAPPRPVMQQGPSPLGLVADIGSSVIDGVTTGISLMPE